jgi:hypothetical protein
MLRSKMRIKHSPFLVSKMSLRIKIGLKKDLFQQLLKKKKLK